MKTNIPFKMNELTYESQFSEIKNHIDLGYIMQMTGSKSFKYDGEQDTDVYYQVALREKGV